MAAYFVVNCTIKNEELLNQYVGGAVNSLGVVPVKLLAMDNHSEAVEGTPAGSRTVVLEFETKEDFHKWYNSPEYQAVVGQRLEATEGFAVLVNGA